MRPVAQSLLDTTFKKRGALTVSHTNRVDDSAVMKQRQQRASRLQSKALSVRAGKEKEMLVQRFGGALQSSHKSSVGRRLGRRSLRSSLHLGKQAQQVRLNEPMKHLQHFLRHLVSAARIHSTPASSLKIAMKEEKKGNKSSHQKSRTSRNRHFQNGAK